jgi:N-acyl-D-aspartate/D-glutamate deacylase
MAHQFDLIVRGGTILDGSGGPGRDGDVAVRDGRIAAVGRVAGSGRDEIDARGQIVAPGFVDIHTHYDGQATWANQLSPSSWHGVTTAVMGNCGVGFAPCRPGDHGMLIRLMEGVEDIPGIVLTEGLAWNWESFPEFLTALEARRHDIDFAVQVPHGPLRVYVMGQRGADREPASAEDIAEMAALARQAVEAGAIGFSTSRTLNHRTSDGQPTPTLTAEADELVGIARGLGAAGRGVLQVVTDFTNRRDEIAMFRRMMAESGRPLSVSLVQADMSPDAWRWILDQIDRANADQMAMRAQVCGRPVGLLFGLELTHNPFSAHPQWRELAALSLEDKVRRLGEPELRARLLAGRPEGEDRFARLYLHNFDRMFALGDPPDYEPRLEDAIGPRARARGIAPAELALEHMLERGGKGLLYYPSLNYSNYSLDPAFEMMQHDHTVLGLGDGGAHVGTICDASFPTSMLTFWTRDRVRGPRLDLPWVIKAHSRDTARAVGLHDRGLIRPGYRADLNVIDYDRLTLRAPEVVHDLPAGGRRLIQRAHGYTATVVAGQISYRDGAPTGALPGRLVRGAQPAPSSQPPPRSEGDR